MQNERGHFFSEGNYDILGPPLTDGYDAMTWIVEAAVVERQGRHDRLLVDRRVADGASPRSGHPAFAAMNVQGFGAGVGRVGPYYEQGNWYRGGAVQMLFITWLYGQQNQVRPMFPQDTPQEDLIRASKSFDLAPQTAAGRLVEGAVAPAGAGHHEERRRPAGHLRRRDAGRDRRRA